MCAKDVGRQMGSGSPGCVGCGGSLSREVIRKGSFVYACADCGGRAVVLAVLRRLIDRGELEQLPAIVEESEPPLPEEARIYFAQAEQRAFELRNRPDPVSNDPPDVWWKVMPALVGLPVEAESRSLKNLPWVTWTVLAGMLLTYLATRGDLQGNADSLGFLPSEWARQGGLTVLTSFFLHGGLWHVLDNGWFLMVFGDDVEDQLGHVRFALLLLVATVSGDLAHLLADPSSTIPSVGASGGISGIVVFHALRFPRARIGLFLRYHWFHVPAWSALALWLLLQAIGVVGQLAGQSDVSAIAHLGGAVIGLLAWLLVRERRAAG